jgi:hypothetical protein
MKTLKFYLSHSLIQTVAGSQYHEGSGADMVAEATFFNFPQIKREKKEEIKAQSMKHLSLSCKPSFQ